jgi:hypothetical protein
VGLALASLALDSGKKTGNVAMLWHHSGGYMSASEVLDRLKHLTNSERLAVIEAATRLIREDLANPVRIAREQDRRLRAAAEAIKDLYEPGGELTEWTALDGEDFHDEPVDR